MNRSTMILIGVVAGLLVLLGQTAYTVNEVEPGDHHAVPAPVVPAQTAGGDQ